LAQPLFVDRESLLRCFFGIGKAREILVENSEVVENGRCILCPRLIRWS
jgi:hypothetical protein